MFFLQLYGKALFAGFLNGLYIGRKLRNGHRKEHIYRVFDNQKFQPTEIKGRVRDFNTVKESDFCVVENN